MNTYRALSPAAVAAYADGVFEHEFTPTEEADALASGLVEIVPRPYRVLSPNFGAGEQGDVVDLALLVENEAALIAGGHLERVDPDEQPAGNATREEWADYARKHGASEDDLLDDDGKPLGRNELRDKYGSSDPTTEKE